MAKDSKMVARRVEAMDLLRSAVDVHGRAAARALEERLTAVLEEGEAMPDVFHLMAVLTRLLERQCRDLDADDDERWGKTLSVQMAREERRRAAAEFRGKLVDLRDSLRAIYGAEQTRLILELEGRTPRGFQELAIYGRWLVRRLRKVELPAPKVELEVDPGAWADSLEPSAKRLKAMVDQLRVGGWREQDAVHARNRSLGAFDADYVPVMRWVESVYLLAGQLQLAKKLRSSHSRRLVNRHAAFAETPRRLSLAWRGAGQRLLGFLARVALRLGLSSRRERC